MSSADGTLSAYCHLHQLRRRAVAWKVEAGIVRCARCGELIKPGTPWDLGHVDGTNHQLYSGPEHRRSYRRLRLRAQARHGSAHHHLHALKLYDDLCEKESERLIVVLRLSPRRLPKPTCLFFDLRLRLLDHDGLLARGLWSSPSASHRTPAELLSLSVR